MLLRLQETFLLCVLPNTQSYLYFKVGSYKKKCYIFYPTAYADLVNLLDNKRHELLTIQEPDNEATLTYASAVTLPFLATKEKLIYQ